MAIRPNQRTSEQSRSNTIKLGQLNLQNSNRATSEARQIMHDRDQPYSINGAVKGFGLTTTNMVLGNQELDERPMAVIVCKSRKEPLHLQQYSTKYFTVCKITTPAGQLILVSGYFQCADQIDPYLIHLQNILDDFKGEEILISIDASAHFHLWYSNEDDQKGFEMAEFIDHNNLTILNRRYQPPTHKSGTNIDLTIATTKTSKLVKSWTVHTETLSDHNLIMLEIVYNGPTLSKEVDKYNTKHTTLRR